MIFIHGGGYHCLHSFLFYTFLVVTYSPTSPRGAHGTHGLAPTESLFQLLYHTPHLPWCVQRSAFPLRLVLPPPITGISRPPSRHHSTFSAQWRSQKSLSFTNFGDNTQIYTPRCILCDLFNIILIHDSVHYHLLTLLMCTLIAAATTPVGSSNAHDNCLSP